MATGLRRIGGLYPWAYYSLDGNTTTSLEDKSGNNRHLEKFGNPIQIEDKDGQPEKAIGNIGSGNYLKTPVFPNLNNKDFSISFWFSVQNLVNHTIFQHKLSFQDLVIAVYNNQLQIYIGSSFYTTITANEWNHITITHTSVNRFNLYVNGACILSNSLQSVSTAIDSFYFGKDTVTTNSVKIDECLIYESVATESEALQLFNAGVNSPPANTPTANILPATFTRPIIVSLIGESESSIRYTIDESEPTESSKLYTKSITLAKTTTIKAVAYKDGFLPSATLTATYIINIGGEQMGGLPSINIAFNQKVAKVISRGSTGILAIILRDTTTVVKEYKMQLVTDIPDALTTDNKDLLRLAFQGTPKEVKAIVISTTDAGGASLDDALDYLEIMKFNLLVAPTATTLEATTIASWIKSVRGNTEGGDVGVAINKKVMAVLANQEADSEGVINFTTESIKVGETTYTTAKFTARIGGLIAGLPLTSAPTYSVLKDVTDIVPRPSKATATALIEDGKLILIHDGEKVKIARGVNSFTTTTVTKAADWQKIKVVRTYDLIHSDITSAIEDGYIGAVQNNYMNKLLLITAIKEYLKALERNFVLDAGKSSVDIDLVEQKAYLLSIGEDVANMSDQQIKEANTKDKVFLSIKAKALDAMEDFAIKINI